MRVGSCARPPLQGLAQTRPPVQLAVRPAEQVPGVGRGAQVVQDPLPLDVLLEPALQPGPGARQRLVGDLDDTGVAGDQTRAHQQVDEVLMLGSPTARSRRGTRLRTGSPSVPGRHQAEHQVTEQVPLVGSTMPAYTVSAERATAPRIPPDAVYPATVRVRPSRRFQVSMRAWDSSGSAPGVPATSPTRRSTRPGFDQQSGLPRRLLDGLAQRLLAHATQEVEAALDQPGERRVGRHLRQPVGAHRHHDRPGPRPTVARARRGTRSARPRRDRARRPPRTGRPPARIPSRGRGLPISDSMGCSPGVSTTVVRPSRRSAAAIPPGPATTCRTPRDRRPSTSPSA